MLKSFYLIFVFIVLWVFLKDLLFYIYECFAYMYVCESHVCLVPMDLRTACQIP